ncbi:glucose-1-phosphate adenylyltransferase, partial [Candidatus Endoriftia persephone str. Guaymas]|nr:glucose-1-phosphate adenylyltransferase [Candidatus Endoriftia persephone str. Guaymas]
GGCVISGSQVKNSLLFSNVRINSFTEVEKSVILPDVNIGRNCRIRNAVIDRGCEIPEGTIIGEDPVADAERFYVSEGGVVLVTPDMLGQVLRYVR